MKLFHLADLHFGKSIYGLSLLEDQRCWAGQFLKLCDEERPDAVLIAGDVYDRAAPSGDAVDLLDFFLTGLAGRGIPVFLIAGNHDSGQRLSFASELLARQQLHIAGTVTRELTHYTFADPDGLGPVTIWLIPYTFPEQLTQVLGEEVRTYEEGMRRLIEAQAIDPSHRNVVLAHQNVTAGGKEAERGGSETMVGGVGQIDYHVYAPFDYAALGHIHSSYPVGREAVRYAGTPLCYHLSETRQPEKGVLEVILGEKGSTPKVRTIPIPPLHRMRYLADTKEKIYEKLRQDPGQNEYIGITLTDERTTPESYAYVSELLTSRGSVLLQFDSSFRAYTGGAEAADRQSVEEKPIEDLFSGLYADQKGGTPPDETEYELLRYVGELLRHGDPHEPADPLDVRKIVEKAKQAGGTGR